MRCAREKCKNQAEPGSNYCDQHAISGGSKTQLKRDVDAPKDKD